MITTVGKHRAAALADYLYRTDHVIVFAESCTAGLISATLGQIPGVSQWLAGSAVVYQIETKTEWLQVDQTLLQDPGPVSQIVSEQMAIGILNHTPQASISASVTGHLGPNAPQNLDGLAWSSIALRAGDKILTTSRLLQLDRHQSADHPNSRSEIDLRHDRQCTAAELVLQFCVEQLES
ncbi:MAG: CinA family protein [Fuerstiella sp.]|nr:CinA family protein [Fuerstiella sp.]